MSVRSHTLAILRAAKVPRARLGDWPSPLQPLPRLSEMLGIRLYCKRDDVGPLPYSGNKVRQLEFSLGEAIDLRASIVVAGGGDLHSNHARLCANAAVTLGMKPVLVVGSSGSQGCSANEMLTRIVCEEIRDVPDVDGLQGLKRIDQVEERRRILDHVADDYRERGEVVFVLPGSTTPVSTLGYFACASELMQQCEDLGVSPDYLVVPSTGATQAGLELGRHVLGARWTVIGIAARQTTPSAAEDVAALTTSAARLIGYGDLWEAKDVVNHDVALSASIEKISRILKLVARTEGVFLDPIYTARGFIGLCSLLDRGVIPRGAVVVFIHTGGLPALFDLNRIDNAA